MSEFPNIYVGRSSNRKHSFFITCMFYQLTNVCSNYAMQFKQMSDSKLAMFLFNFVSIQNVVSVQFRKNLKNRHCVVGGLKTLKLSTNTCFGASFQKNVFSSLLLFLSVCYQDELSDSERNKIASLSARNFNNS